eukprot:g14540.t1
MARVSLFYTVAGARFCRGFAFAPFQRSRVAFQRTWGEAAEAACLKPASRTAATTAHSAWRKESAVHSFVVVPDGVEQSRSQHPDQHQLQPSASVGDEGSRTHRPSHHAAIAATAKREEHLEKSRTIGPDKKRILRIPEEEWPRYPNFSFTVESECVEGTKARCATLSTPHGDVQTPAFIFCATKAAVKGLSAETMKACGSQIILSNTYHLLVQPGGEIIEKMGGLQKATRWEGPMLTDSGGYQIFSMGHGSVGDEIKGRRGAEGFAEFAPSLVSIGEKGARFRSYHDCSIKSLTPERSIEIQRQLGADLIVVLGDEGGEGRDDECTPFHVDKEYTESSMRRTHRWAMRSLREFIDGDDGAQALYGIVQGGVYPDLRKEAVDFVNKAPFFGIAVGGSLGADKATMHQVVSDTMANVRRDRPVHLLGIGGIADLFHGVRQGIDTFDCVHPTRLGRHGGALVKASFWERERERELQAEAATGGGGGAVSAEGVEGSRGGEEGVTRGVERRNRTGGGGGSGSAKQRQRFVPREHVNLLKARYADDHRVIDEDCGCPTCRGGYTRAYINHLGRAGELLGGMLVSQHNVFFMNELMASIREAIREGRLDEEEERWLAPGLRSRDFHGTSAEQREAEAAAAAAAAAGQRGGGAER